LVPDPVACDFDRLTTRASRRLAVVVASAGDELGPLETKFATGALATIVLMKELG
jgi:hypothetical protein